MELGNRVKFIRNPDKGLGKIIDIKNLFGKKYYSVYFENDSKILEVREDEIELSMNFNEKLFKGIFDTPEEFLFNTMGKKLNSLYYSEMGIAASNFKIKPLPHQILALNFVLNQFRPRCLLADEVGLGKTIEAALIYEELKLRGMGNRILIICPASLGKQWQEELQNKFNESFFLMDKDGANSLKSLYGEKGNIWNEYDRVICSMDFLKPRKIGDKLFERVKNKREEHNRRIFQDCIEAGWDIVIIDEAHKLTKEEEETARYKMGKAFSESVPIFLLLSATPHRGKPEIFKSLLQLIDDEMFESLKDINPENVSRICIRNNKRAAVDMEGKRLFKDRITDICKIDRKSQEDQIELELYDAISNYVSEYYDYAVKENNTIMMFLLLMYQRIVSSSSQAILRALTKRFDKLNKLSEISNLIEDVGIDDFMEQSSENQIRILEENSITLKNPKLLKGEKEIIGHCIELARKATIGRHDAKFKMLLRILDEIKMRERKTDIKIIIFTEFTETQKYIRTSLESMDYKTAVINGNLSLEEKMNQKEYFRSEADFLISTDAGGEGLNLQFAAHMINYDIPWNPMILEQRIGRIDRIGQKEIVKIFNFVLKDSVEERVRETLENKLEIIKEQFGTDQVKDILSTLQEDFSFDKIYIDAVKFRQKQGEELEELAQKLYNDARSILEKNQFLLPFTKETEIQPEQKILLETLPEKVKNFVKIFLSTKGEKLEEYKEKKGVYHFKNLHKDIYNESQVKNVIFDAQIGIEFENTELLSLQSRFIKKLIKESNKSGSIAKFSIKNKKFSGKKGLLGYYHLIIKNNFDFRKEVYFPIFIESEIRYNSRITAYFEMAGYLETEPFISPDFDFQEALKKMEDTSNFVGEEKFLSIKNQWQNKIQEKIQQIEKYYAQKRMALEKIAIINIRDSKIKKLLEDYEIQKLKYEQEIELFPEMECSQIALVNFGDVDDE